MYLSEGEKDLNFLCEYIFRQQISVELCKLKVWPAWCLGGQFVGLTQSSPAQTNPTLLESFTQHPRWSAGSFRPYINQTLSRSDTNVPLYFGLCVDGKETNLPLAHSLALQSLLFVVGIFKG